MTASNDSGTHLTTSRISRLFRPLRAKCLALTDPPASSTSSSRSRQHASTTYTNPSRTNHSASSFSLSTITNHTSSVFTSRAFSLAHIPPPAQCSKLHADGFDRDMLSDLTTLSKKIYEVRDAFRNILNVAFGGANDDDIGTTEDEPSDTVTSRPPRVLSLGSMCASLVGENMETQTGEDGDEEKGVKGILEECKDMDLMDELYEAVPPHYRRYAMVSHALCYILDNCPHYPTLLSTLLDVTLTYRLVPESHRLLYQLCLVACHRSPFCHLSTSNLGPPQIASSQFSDFLLTLRDKCCRGSGVQGRGSTPLIADKTFSRIFASAVSESQTETSAVWACRATIGLASTLRSRDYVTCLPLCVALATCISDMTSARNKLVDTSEERERLERTLERWTQGILDHLHSTRPEDEPNLGQHYLAIVDFLAECHTLGIHRLPAPMDGHSTQPGLVCVLTGLVTFCLGSPLFSSLLSSGSRQVLRDILRVTRPISETYDKLASTLLPREHRRAGDRDSPSHSPIVHHYAQTLRAHKFYLHEASYCSAALRRVEELLSTSRKPPADWLFGWLDTLRVELVDRVEVAERLCYGSRSSVGTQRGLGDLARHGRRKEKENEWEGAEEGEDVEEGMGEWEWEETMGCWVKKSPKVAKKTKKRRMQRELVGISAVVAPRRLNLSSSTSSSAAPKLSALSRSRSQSRRTSSRSTKENVAPILSSASLSSLSWTSSTSRSNSSRSTPLSLSSFGLSPDGDSRTEYQDFLVEITLPSSPSSFFATTAPNPKTPLPKMGPKRTNSGTSTRPQRRISNFDTILADAQMNCTTLHTPNTLKRNRWVRRASLGETGDFWLDRDQDSEEDRGQEEQDSGSGSDLGGEVEQPEVEDVAGGEEEEGLEEYWSRHRHDERKQRMKVSRPRFPEFPGYEFELGREASSDDLFSYSSPPVTGRSG